MIDYLKSKGLYDNTFIILDNDHGRVSKGMLYEHGSRIVQSIRYPPSFTDNGYVLPNDFIVDTADVAAVIFDLAQIDLNAEFPDYVIDSKNWLNDVEEYIENTQNGTQRDYDLYPPIVVQRE